MIASLVYVLCTLASGLCAVLLWRAYLRTRGKLLFWSTICFVGLCANNIVLGLDMVVYPDVDLSIWRLIPALIGVAALGYGLIVEAE